MVVKVSDIFKERPSQWGLRGDPYLWEDLEKHFSDFIIPYPEEVFKEEMGSKFNEITGHSIDSKEFIHIPQYSHGGMSSGGINPEFWLNIALPLLLERLQGLNHNS